ncbi:YceD family protein [Guyparkeria sp.]|uniref:YceD family protein n=1 Tax=Guyparkeria sp. TaxID=2035736 RepID=UPI00356360E5
MPRNDSQLDTGRLTIPLDVRAACRQELVESGEAPLAGLSRCREITPEGGMFAYEVRFFEGQGVHPLQADIRVSAPLQLECSRCMEPMVKSVAVASRVTFVFSDEQAEHVETETEPVVLGREGRIRLVDLLEDEILMAVPLMPVHEDACSDLAAGQAYESGQIDESASEEREENPFAALAALKKGPGGGD